MEDKDKEMITEQKDIVTVEAAADGKPAETVEFGTVDAAAQAKPAKEKKDSWWNRAVTGKVLTIALAIMLAANAALTAGISAIFAKSSRHDMQGGRPGSEMMGGDQSSGQSGNGQMTPPGGGQSDQNGQSGQGGAPGDSQSSEQSSKASIGIVVKDDDGVIVAQVTGDNAKKAGFEEGDKIVSFEGEAISSSSDLIKAVQSHSAGDSVTVTVERDGQNVDIKTELE